MQAETTSSGAEMGRPGGKLHAASGKMQSTPFHRDVRMNLLLIDDETTLRRTMRTVLESMGHQVAETAGGDAGLDLLGRQVFDLAFLDLRLGRESGLDLLPKLLRAAPSLGVIIVTAYASVNTAVEAMRSGAFDYLPKPFTPDQLRVVLERWQLVQGLRFQVSDLQDQVRQFTPEADLRTQEPSMQAALDMSFQVAASEATVLLRGESGTGKGVLARALHARSSRAKRPFVTVHCPSLSPELLESDLFGHVRGAFTGAVQDAEGKVAAADGGTLFLDEIGDLPLSVQAKLLRFVQEKAFERVGETRTRHADVRIVTATNRDLETEVAAGRFREDLLYRLNVIEIRLPPLRERRGDLPALADHLLRFFARQSGKRVKGFTKEAREAIRQHDWPGNLRELRNAVERAVILTRSDEIGLADLPAQLGKPPAKLLEVGGAATLDELEAEHIRRILAAAPSLEAAAETLGIDPSTLYRKRKRYGL
jgi:NtrC-family two-component system response regulator AlgB